MTAFNVVRLRVKPGYEQRFIDTHRKVRPEFEGFVRGNLIRTGERTFCMVGEWRDMNSLVAARPEMIAVLDALREMLEDLGEELGLTDPVSGESVYSFGSPEAKKKSKAQGGKKKKKAKTKKKAKAKKKAKKKPKKRAKKK